MNNYEGIFIVNPDLAPEASKGVVAQIQEMVSKNGGRVDGLQDWGRKKLTYKIQKKSEGHYVLLNFQLDGPATKKLEQAIRLNDNVMRYLIINKEEK